MRLCSLWDPYALYYPEDILQTSDGSVRYFLSLVPHQEMDITNYTCTARNNIGESSATVLLTGFFEFLNISVKDFFPFYIFINLRLSRSALASTCFLRRTLLQLNFLPAILAHSLFHRDSGLQHIVQKTTGTPINPLYNERFPH